MEGSANRCFICANPLAPATSGVYARCSYCGHELRLEQSPAAPMLNEELGEHVRKPDLKDRFQVTITLLASRGRVLLIDVGSGSGRFLYQIRGKFKDILGIEPSDGAREFASRTLGIPTQAQLPLERLKDASVVSFWHSLEHIPHPQMEALLETLHQDLPKESALVISVPNNSGLHARLFAAHSVYYDLQNHFHQFSTQSLETLLAKHSFDVRSFHTSFAYSFLGNLLSFVNLFFTEHNLVYLTLRRAHTYPGSRMLLMLKTAGLCICFAPFALVLYLFEALFPRQGAVITLIADPRT